MTTITTAEKKLSITELLKDPKKHVEADSCAFFYDWFCAENGLKNRALVLIDKLKFLVEEGLVDGDENYVWFKNNCPLSGSTYDDMRISRIEGDEFLGGFCFASGHTGEKNKANLWLLGAEVVEGEAETETDSNARKLGHALFEFPLWRDMKKELKTNQGLRGKIKAHYKQG